MCVFLHYYPIQLQWSQNCRGEGMKAHELNVISKITLENQEYLEYQLRASTLETQVWVQLKQKSL